MALSLIFSALFIFVIVVGVGFMAWKLHKTRYKKLSLPGLIIIVIGILGMALAEAVAFYSLFLGK